ncbi:hypothetical protein KIN20_010425 [Parelaphostrongylus tenuis]|uniref:Uncharacterized protein n=1 Tax=Parelaphostrongylus tenuis TaxID=148309 RepID=A0AAD5QP47_PARTN|nr:hypothetical protein KIN20_010425 [Parelaphostrongylus tenuis]
MPACNEPDDFYERFITDVEEFVVKQRDYMAREEAEWNRTIVEATNNVRRLAFSKLLADLTRRNRVFVKSALQKQGARPLNPPASLGSTRSLLVRVLFPYPPPGDAPRALATNRAGSLKEGGLPAILLLLLVDKVKLLQPVGNGPLDLPIFFKLSKRLIPIERQNNIPLVILRNSSACNWLMIENSTGAIDGVDGGRFNGGEIDLRSASISKKFEQLPLESSMASNRKISSSKLVYEG